MWKQYLLIHFVRVLENWGNGVMECWVALAASPSPASLAMVAYPAFTARGCQGEFGSPERLDIGLVKA